MGKTQGVRDSSRPNTKKLAMMTQKFPPWRIWAMRPLSDVSVVAGDGVSAAGAVPAPTGMAVRSTSRSVSWGG